mgnify:CR=1 FL=1
MIGSPTLAVVGVQPFGGEGLSGTGPKAGGPHYLSRFIAGDTIIHVPGDPSCRPCDQQALARAIEKVSESTQTETSSRILPGPTGETNILTLHGRGVILCLNCAELAGLALAAGNGVVLCGDEAGILDRNARLQRVAGRPDPAWLTDLAGIAAVAATGGVDYLRTIRVALAARPGAIVPLISGPADAAMLVVERTLSINTTASGGNAALLASAGEDL